QAESGLARSCETPQDQDRFDPPDFEQRHERKEQRDQQPHTESLQRGLPRQSEFDVERNATREHLGQQRRDDLRKQESHQAAQQSERENLRQISAEDAGVLPTQAFQNRDRLHLLLDEDARHAGDADATEHQNDQTDQAQVIFDLRQRLAHPILRIAERANRHVWLLLQVTLQGFKQRLHIALAGFEERAVADAAAPFIHTGGERVVIIDNHARAEAEGVHPAARLALDFAANREIEVADPDLVADLQTERRHQALFDQRATIFQQIVG